LNPNATKQDDDEAVIWQTGRKIQSKKRTAGQMLDDNDAVDNDDE
jgi:hypothetical protein